MNDAVMFGASQGQSAALNAIVRRGNADDGATLATLLLLEEAPHPAAALVVVAKIRRQIAPPMGAALIPRVAPALAAWRADPHWGKRLVAADGQWRATALVAPVIDALLDRPAALRDAVAILLRDGDDADMLHCLMALGSSGWAALDADQRVALLEDAPAAALGWVWNALDEEQRMAAVQAVESDSFIAAKLIGRIGAAAWEATASSLRSRMIDAVVRSPNGMAWSAPAWTGMTDREREALATAMIERGRAFDAFRLLDDLGPAGRAALTAAQRAALESRALEVDARRVLAWRAADGGWTALSDTERTAILTAAVRPAEQAPGREEERDRWTSAALLRTVGVAGWTAMREDERARLAAAVRRDPDALFRCPPALWSDLADDAPPPASTIPADAPTFWRAEDAAADLGRLPPSHQTLVLALAPWRQEDASSGSARVRRLLAAWGDLTADDRVALATAHPAAAAVVAGCAWRRSADGGDDEPRIGGAAAAIDAVGETVARAAHARSGAGAAARIVAAMLAASPRWRPWMELWAPTDDDPPEVWAPWRDAVRSGIIPNPALCARLATTGGVHARCASERRRTKPTRRLP